MNVKVCVLGCPPSSLATTLSRIGTNNRERGISSSVLNMQSLSDIQREVDGVSDALLYPFMVSVVEVQRMLCWMEEEEEEEGRDERWKDEFERVRVDSSMHITPSPVSLNVLSLTSAVHSLNRMREAFRLQRHSLCVDAECVV